MGLSSFRLHILYKHSQSRACIQLEAMCLTGKEPRSLLPSRDSQRISLEKKKTEPQTTEASTSLHLSRKLALLQRHHPLCVRAHDVISAHDLGLLLRAACKLHPQQNSFAVTQSCYLSLMDMVLPAESRMPSTAGTLISPAANMAHGFLEYFSCPGSAGSCCLQDTGAAVWATVFPVAVPVCSEVGSPNSAAGKERSHVSTPSSRQTFLQLFTPSGRARGVQSGGAGGLPNPHGFMQICSTLSSGRKAICPGAYCTAESFVTTRLFLCARHSFNYTLQSISPPPKPSFSHFKWP